MAESLSMIARRMPGRAAAFVFVLYGIVAGAENLPDPTRPPASLGIAPDGTTSDSNPGPRLQSVLIAPGRRVAIVSGKTVEVGGKVGGATVAAISEGEVVLRNGKNLQTLKLFPEVEKHPASGSVISKSHFGSQPVKDK